jgi:hypothetical protein
VSNREDIDGAGGDRTDRVQSVKYAAATALPLPSRVPRKGKPTKDQRIRRVVREARTLAPHLDDRLFTPVLEGFARVSILLKDAYERIRNQELIGPDGELRSSIETVRRLADTQAKLAEKLGMTPSTLKAMRREKKGDLAAAFVEIEDAQ